MFPSPIATRDEGKIYRVVTGASGRVLAVVVDSLDGEVRLLDAQTLSPHGALLLGAARTARGCALGPDDALLAAATPDDVQLFDLVGAASRWTVPRLGDEPAIAFAPDGKQIAVGTVDGGAVLLDAADGAATAELGLGTEARALLWDAHGLVALEPEAFTTARVDGTGARTHRLSDPGDEAFELVSVDRERIAIAGAAPGGVWLELRARDDGALLGALSLEEDRRAEGLAYAGGVLFLATEGGVYRADPPYDQLVRWLPALGGAHDPTRLAAVADGHIAVAAHDVRVFRTRS